MSSKNDWVKTFLQLPLPLKVGALGLLLIIFLLTIPRRPNSPPADPDGYLFCFWNVENLFDDINDDKRREVDEKYNHAFATDEKVRATKLANLSKVLLAMNDGKGPDILAVAELESDRALEMLQDRLNHDLGDRAKKYDSRLFHEQKVGRHIAPGILTRLPVEGDRTQRLGAAYHRILEGHIRVDGKQLVVVVAHWTSRVARPGGKDDSKNEEQRKKYADVVYGRFKAMYLANPKVAFLTCGDFNDDPTDASVVENLRGIGDKSSLTSGDEPRLFNLAANRDLDKFGTLSYHSRWHLFDQILVSAGMVNGADWSVNPDSFRVERDKMADAKGRPWSFDRDDRGRSTENVGERGFADHFPVTVRLKVR